MEFKDAVAEVDRLYARINARRDETDKHERYYLGEQSLTFATKEWMEKNGARFDSFSDNWCAPVSDAMGERLGVNGIKLRGADKADESLWEMWLRNEMEMQSSQGFLTSLNARRSYAFVWFDPDDPDEPVVTWEHPSSVEIEYDWIHPLRRKSGLKTWADETHEYAVLYKPTEIYKFRRPRASLREGVPQTEQMRVTGSGGGWAVWEVRDETWPIKNPLGLVPIVEIPNRPILHGEPVSEVAKVIPLQDAINILWAYAMHAADFASMPARVLLNTNPPMRKITNAAGEQVGVEPVTMDQLNEARFAVFNSGEGKQASIDSWPAASLEVFTDVIEIAVGHVAAQTRTPPHYLVSNKGLSNLAADALKAAEIGLVKKAIEFQTYATPAIRELFRLMVLVKGSKTQADALRLATVVWANPEMRSESQLADALVKKKNIGYPVKWLLELDGVSPTDQKRILGMMAEERRMLAEEDMQEVANNELGSAGFGSSAGEDPRDRATVQPAADAVAAN